MKKVKIKNVLCILPILCLVLCDCGSKKITQQKLGDITGQVFAMDTGSPIPDVLVSCSGISDSTDYSGTYSLSNIPVGLRTVNASKAGYQSWSASIDVRKGNNILDIYMNSATSNAKGIVFCSQRIGSTQLFVMDSDGSKQLQLTNLVIPEWRGDRSPLWSPDKKKIVFVAALEEFSYDLMSISSDGTALDTLVYVRDAVLGDWSPDGSHIVYHAYSTIAMPIFPHFDVFIINSDGSGDLELIPGEEPRFCGNDKVVYTAEDNIYIINTDGTGKEHLSAPHISGYKYMPVASPDGSKIAFGVDLLFDCVHYALGIMNSDGSEDTILVLEFGRKWINEIEFSHDSQKILYLTNEDDNSEIFVINVDGGGLDSLTGGIACGDGGACWSPDGNWIAFTSNRKGNKDIYKVSVDGKILIQLTDDVTDDFSPDW